jgi:hypothetical protein
MKEVTAVINTIVKFDQHAAHIDVTSGMPVSGRVRMASLRALPMTTGVVSSNAGQTCALTDVTRGIDGYLVATDVFVVKGAFPGTSAWSPPI